MHFSLLLYAGIFLSLFTNQANAEGDHGGSCTTDLDCPSQTGCRGKVCLYAYQSAPGGYRCFVAGECSSLSCKHSELASDYISRCTYNDGVGPDGAECHHTKECSSGTCNNGQYNSQGKFVKAFGYASVCVNRHSVPDTISQSCNSDLVCGIYSRCGRYINIPQDVDLYPPGGYGECISHDQRIQLGEKCNGNDSCASGNCPNYDPNTPSGLLATCAAPRNSLNLGDTCVRGAGTCKTNLYCEVNNVCKAALASSDIGDSCVQNAGTCKINLYCSARTSSCQANQNSLNIGDSCVQNAGTCKINLYCNARTNSCQVPAARNSLNIGGDCIRDTGDCKINLYCDPSTKTCQANTGTKGFDEECIPDGSDCISHTVRYAVVPNPLGPDGQPIESVVQFYAWSCNYPVPLFLISATCSFDGDCASNYCRNNICATGARVGPFGALPVAPKSNSTLPVAPKSNSTSPISNSLLSQSTTSASTATPIVQVNSPGPSARKRTIKFNTWE